MAKVRRLDATLPREIRDWIVRKYRDSKIDVIVAVGPQSIEFMAGSPKTLFPDIPIVSCGSTKEQAGEPKLDSRFTGTLAPG